MTDTIPATFYLVALVSGRMQVRRVPVVVHGEHVGLMGTAPVPENPTLAQFLRDCTTEELSPTHAHAGDSLTLNYVLDFPKDGVGPKARRAPQLRSSALDRIFDDIAVERARQDARWGGPGHDDEHDLLDWRRFISEHMTTAFVASERATIAKIPNPLPSEAAAAAARMECRRELVQAAALAVAALESFDRKGSL